MPHTERLLPVLIGGNLEKPLMARAVVDRTKPGEVTITIQAKGDDADFLANFLEVTEPIALSFAGIPVQPRKNHIKE